MPESDLPARAVLEALGFALFLRDEAGALRIAGVPPQWLARLWPSVAYPGAKLQLAEASPFLENFLIDAQEGWREAGGQRIRSGPWVERGPDGTEMQLEATALLAEGQAVLLVKRLGEAFETSRMVLQRARETVIAYQRLEAEIQKKQILVHSLAEDLSASLSNVITALRLMELENHPPRTTQLLGLALRGTDEQRSLMHKLLDLFAEELRGLYGSAGSRVETVDLAAIVRRAIVALEPRFGEKGVRVREREIASGLMIAGEPSQLERIIGSLLENALENSPATSEIEVCLVEEPDWALVRVEDRGITLKPEIAARILSKFEPERALSHPSFLRLHFCRIAVQSCRGEIGYDPVASGGNCLWIRLPTSRALQ